MDGSHFRNCLDFFQPSTSTYYQVHNLPKARTCDSPPFIRHFLTIEEIFTARRNIKYAYIKRASQFWFTVSAELDLSTILLDSPTPVLKIIDVFKYLRNLCRFQLHTLRLIRFNYWDCSCGHEYDLVTTVSTCGAPSCMMWAMR